MSSLNKAMLIGHLGREPEVRYMPNGDAVASFSIATSDRWKDKQTGENREATEWHNITAFRQLGEICGKYLTKGSLVYIEGKITTQKYTDKDGVERYSTKIIADTMQMLGGKDGNKQQEDKTEPRQQSRQNTNAGRNQAAQQGNFDDMNDPIPF